MIPPIPPARGYESTTTVELRPRYEDISQDGRVQLTTMGPGLGAVWRSLGDNASSPAHDVARWFREKAILPVLRRLVIEGDEGPHSVSLPLSSTGTWRLARETGGDRLFLDMWLEIRAPRATTFGPPPAPDAERVLAGRIYAEHVITKPFAPAGERKVTRLDVAGFPALPEDTHAFEEAERLLESRELTRVADRYFGTMHTDSNQHVNSLVYARLFEEAVVSARAVADAPAASSLLARELEIRWRKPFFAGERASILAHFAEASDGSLVATGAFVPHDAPSGTRPNCTIRMVLRPARR